MHKEFDIIVIGAGAGAKIATPAARKGFSVAYIEKGPFGGTCLNRGCIPSKMLIHVADLLEEMRDAHRFGISFDTESISVDWDAVVGFTAREIDKEADSIVPMIQKNENVTWYKEEGFFIDDKVLQVGDETITAEKIFIVAGGRPWVPPIPGLEGTPYMTSKEALRLEKQPKSMIVIGGGYIGCELAHFYGGLGTEITIVDRGDRFLKLEDDEVSAEFTKIFSAKHRALFMQDTQKVAYENGEFILSLKHRETGEEQEIRAEQLLIATGRKPNTDVLKIRENTSLNIDDRGFLQVNEFLETNVPGVWAYGDIIGRYQFRHSANYEGETVFRNVIEEKPKEAMNYKAMPHAVFSNPQVAGVGATEEELKVQGIPYVVGKRNYIQSGMGMALRSEHGFVKLLAHKETRKLLGAHIIGYEASTMIHELIYAMRYDATIDDIRETIHIHPALSELIPKAITSMNWNS